MELTALVCLRIEVKFTSDAQEVEPAPMLGVNPTPDEQKEWEKAHTAWERHQKKVLASRVAAAKHAERQIAKEVRDTVSKLGTVVTLSVEEVRQ